MAVEETTEASSELGGSLRLSPDEVLDPGSEEATAETDSGSESVEQPAKVMRIGTMVKQLLDEVRAAPLDEAGRARLKEIYETSVAELAKGLSPDLRDELERMAPPLGDEIPSSSELRVAQAQLVGWLEGLFHGIQAALMAQQMAARAQLDQMRQQSLPEGAEPGSMRPGTYL
jgi:hypothetical protein